MLRRIGVLASLAVFATMFAGVTSAQAQSVGGCVFTGLAGNLVDDQNGASGIPSIQKDLADGDLSDSEFGSYNYGGSAVCSGTFNGKEITPEDDVTITSNGHYENKACGTGWAQDLNGSGTTITSVSAEVTITNVGYEIPFIGGTGPLFIGPPNQSTAPSTEGQPITGDYSGTGAVHIQPVDPDNCVTTDTNEFTVAGSFSAAGL